MTNRAAVKQEFMYVYGPVPSRRLGRSLGIDPIPLKTCNWNCVYCQLGRTRPVVNVRKEYVSPKAILEQVERTLAELDPETIDWVTFVGSGEPLLNAGIGLMIRQVKTLTDIPVAVITNGALLYLSEVRDELAPADAVLPSLDGGTPYLYRKINRPHPEITLERHLEGLTKFSLEYRGFLWPEVMLVRGLNDSEVALRKLADAFQKVRIDKIHLNTPTRPPVETWVQPPDEKGLIRAKAILGNIADVVHPINGNFNLGGYPSVVDAVIGIITRHPMREEELKLTLSRWAPGEVNQALFDLNAGGKAQIVERNGVRFWSAAGSFYPDEDRENPTSDRSRH